MAVRTAVPVARVKARGGARGHHTAKRMAGLEVPTALPGRADHTAWDVTALTIVHTAWDVTVLAIVPATPIFRGGDHVFTATEIVSASRHTPNAAGWIGPPVTRTPAPLGPMGVQPGWWSTVGRQDNARARPV